MTQVRRARLADVPGMMPLLNEYVQQAEILPRTEQDVYRSIREWVVVEAEANNIVGMGSLLVMWHDLAEIRSLVIDPAFQGLGLGGKIVDMLLDEAKSLEVGRVFALTRKPGFFLKLGFQLTDIKELPRKVQHDCVFCPKFHACDEMAVVMPLKNVVTIHETLKAAKASDNGVIPQKVIPLITK